MAANLVKQIVLAAGAWELSGGTCKASEKQFQILLEELKEKESLNHEDAIEMVLKEVS